MSRHLVLYDDDCGVCQKFKAVCERLDWLALFRFLPFQGANVLTGTGLTLEACREELKLVRSDGVILGGGDAIVFLMLRFPLTTLVTLPFLVPGGGALLRFVYRKIAANRGRLGSQCGAKQP